MDSSDLNMIFGIRKEKSSVVIASDKCTNMDTYFKEKLESFCDVKDQVDIETFAEEVVEVKKKKRKADKVEVDEEVKEEVVKIKKSKRKAAEEEEAKPTKKSKKSKKSKDT